MRQDAAGERRDGAAGLRDELDRGGVEGDRHLDDGLRRARGVAHDLRHVVVHRRAVALCGLVRRPEADHRARYREPFLERDDARHGLDVRLASRREVHHVQLADQVQRNALPARGHERRRVARVLDAVLVADREEDVRGHQEQEHQSQQDEREDEDDLPRSGSATLHHSIQSG